MSRFIQRAKDGALLDDTDLTESNKRWAHPWQLVYRISLHEELKRVATSEEGPGTPAKLFISTKVVAVDPEQGVVSLEDGTTVVADVVLGADGIYVGTGPYHVNTSLRLTGSTSP